MKGSAGKVRPPIMEGDQLPEQFRDLLMIGSEILQNLQSPGRDELGSDPEMAENAPYLMTGHVQIADCIALALHALAPDDRTCGQRNL